MLLISFTLMLYQSSGINIDITTIIEILMNSSNYSLISKFTSTTFSAIYDYILTSKPLVKQLLEATEF